jgi:hypothetical protein
MPEFIKQNLSIEDKNLIKMMTLLSVFAGMWLVVSPFSFGYTNPVAIWNQVIAGVIILLLSMTRFLFPGWNWASWTNFALGLWLIAAPLILSYSPAAAYWNEAVEGVLVALASLGAARVSHNTITYTLKRN